MSGTTHDCEPTLTDSQVLAFCRNGYMMLEAVVGDEINQRTLDFVDQNTELEPRQLLAQPWFVEHVIRNPAATGAIRSLLGRDFHLPVLMANHRRVGLDDIPGKWHVDGNYQFNHQLQYLQVFYYPQDTPAEMGPTEIVPGSHFWRNQTRAMWHLNHILGAMKTAAPAGTIFLTVYHIWHRAGMVRQDRVRNLLKYFYWRTAPPQRDWIAEPGFDFATADYEGYPTKTGPQFRTKNGEQFRAGRDVAEMFYWLCGIHERFEVAGGQSWPLTANRKDTRYGFPGPVATADR